MVQASVSLMWSAAQDTPLDLEVPVTRARYMMIYSCTVIPTNTNTHSKQGGESIIQPYTVLGRRCMSPHHIPRAFSHAQEWGCSWCGDAGSAYWRDAWHACCSMNMRQVSPYGVEDGVGGGGCKQHASDALVMMTPLSRLVFLCLLLLNACSKLLRSNVSAVASNHPNALLRQATTMT